MSQRTLHVAFEHEDDLLSATRAVRQRGLPIIDIFTPYAVHGLDDAMGLKPSRLTWVCFMCGMFGALAMLWFQHWTASIDWALNVGGKPWNSLPSDVPVGFEAAVLLAGFGSVFALFGVCRLFPGKEANVVSPRVTDDQFVMVLEQSDATFDASSLSAWFQKFHAVGIAEQISEEGSLS